MKKVVTLLLILIFLATGTGLALGDGTTVDYSGSLEAGMISQSINNDFFLGSSSLTGYPTFGNRIKWQNDLRIIPNDQVTLKLRVSYLNDTTQPTLLQNDQFVFSRGFIDFTPNSGLSLRFGKQRLAWGTGYAWNPTDILDQPRDAFTDIDDPEGVLAFRSDINLGPVTTQVVITPNQSWDSSGRALRFKASPGGVDLSLGVVQNSDQTAATIGDFACSLSGVGLHGELLYQPEGNSRPDKTDIFNYLIGIDYNFPGGYYLAAEYYHNDQAYKSMTEFQNYINYKQSQMITAPSSDPLYALQVAAFQSYVMDYLTDLGNNGGVMQNHLFLHGMKKFGEDFNVDLMLIYNPESHSLVGQPEFEYIWGQNTSIFIKALFAGGDSSSEASVLPIQNSWNLGMKVSF